MNTGDYIQDIIRSFLNGATTVELGKKYGVSRERIRQLLKMEGYTSKDGGHFGGINKERRLAANNKKKQDIQKIKDSRVKRIYGCSYALWEELGGHTYKTANGDDPSQPIYKFRNIRNQCKHNGIEWNLTLEQWWDIWQKSGQWKNRGTKKGQYVLARKDKSKPYKIGNVHVVLAECAK